MGGKIVQGSAGVLIGAPTGVACSVCPNSPIEEVNGHPVNPLLGAKAGQDHENRDVHHDFHPGYSPLRERSRKAHFLYK
ncbi:TPA: hypothetical protein N2F43_004315 [Salmonella enterica]|nr:hypothetical protein [Salmonella enterica]